MGTGRTSLYFVRIHIRQAERALHIQGAENVVTLCYVCHDQYDNGAGGREMKPRIAAYLRSQYPDWDERKLVYRKYGLPDM